VRGIQVGDSGHGIPEERPDFVIRILDFLAGNTIIQLEICYISKENVEAYSVPFLPRSLMWMGAGAALCVISAIPFHCPALPVHVPEPYPVSERMVGPILVSPLRRHVEKPISP